MPYFQFKADDGHTVTAHVCGFGLRGCYLCGRLSERQCDAFVAPPSRRRCNRHLCAQHATSLGPDKDACPEHAPMCLAALERRNGSRLLSREAARDGSPASTAAEP